MSALQTIPIGVMGNLGYTQEVVFMLISNNKKSSLGGQGHDIIGREKRKSKLPENWVSGTVETELS